MPYWGCAGRRGKPSDQGLALNDRTCILLTRACKVSQKWRKSWQMDSVNFASTRIGGSVVQPSHQSPVAPDFTHPIGLDSSW